MRCKNCGYKVSRNPNGDWIAPIGTRYAGRGCIDGTLHEVEPLVLTDTRSFTSSAIVSPVVLSAHVRTAIGEVNAAAAIIADQLVPDGDFEIQVIVKQKMKFKEQ